MRSKTERYLSGPLPQNLLSGFQASRVPSWQRTRSDDASFSTSGIFLAINLLSKSCNRSFLFVQPCHVTRTVKVNGSVTAQYIQNWLLTFLPGATVHANIGVANSDYAAVSNIFDGNDWRLTATNVPGRKNIVTFCQVSKIVRLAHCLSRDQVSLCCR